ncbi:MAG TPA: thiamine pyrophosphate-dependent enzyme [Acidobacteriaceae bacterium]|nr:thiamine pyrophosphate-dependent enzyme [Acidobacteriaceae bacterium]
MSPKKAAYENPLIPNARLKQMYRAILRARLLGQALPPRQRALTAGREAALVSTSLDLTARDFVSDAFSSPVVDFVGGMRLRDAVRPHRHFAGGMIAGPNCPCRIPAMSGQPLTAIGIAFQGKAVCENAKRQAKNSESSNSDSSVAVTYSTPGQLSAADWKSALEFAGLHDLPVLFVVLPAATGKKPKFDLRAIAHRARVPAMPVDAADPVALYRAAQESIGHARIGGGPAVIECVAFPAETRNSASAHNTAIAHLEQYLISRGIATRAWLDRDASSFASQIRSVKSASK